MSTFRYFQSDLLVDFSTQHKSILAALLVSSLMADTMLSNISDIIPFGSYEGKALFLFLVVVIYGSGYLLFLGYSKKKVLRSSPKQKIYTAYTWE
jgi:hypothetical protein